MSFNLNQVTPSGGALASAYIAEMIEADLKNAVNAMNLSVGITQAQQKSYEGQANAAIASGEEQQNSLVAQGQGQFVNGGLSIGGVVGDAIYTRFKQGAINAANDKVTRLETVEKNVIQAANDVEIGDQEMGPVGQNGKSIVDNMKNHLLQDGTTLDDQYQDELDASGNPVTYKDKLAQLGSNDRADLRDWVSKQKVRASKSAEGIQSSVQTTAQKFDTVFRAVGNMTDGGLKEFRAGAAEAAKAQHDADNACLRSQSTVLDAESRTFNTWYDGQNQAAGKAVDARTQILLANRQ